MGLTDGVQLFQAGTLNRTRHPGRGAPPSRKLQARDFVDNADGFHNLEYDETGTAYRWTGPGHFTRARLYVDRSIPTMVVLTLSSLGQHTAHNRVTEDVDGTVYPMHRLDGAMITLRAGPLPPRDQAGAKAGEGAGLTDLFFHIPVTFSPRDSGTNDARVLGVAVFSIEIVPHV